ncbi:type II toxin-antitoxin system YafQ family toxin [Bacteroides sp. ET71]|uniref:type II toxin-antitoxin system YafQ family toxin n=1 Tax=Bacteroides sp. ET71 TaxID=2939421 RepID=UPI0020111DC2|nr:type II toxin-antitoxin system YafQ family toxin [Bacteroides sp. ET71]MCL1615126.1 type II toxin-antitoxin system YafQ family toxin [Bacteroides sp. ET71]
MKTVRFSSQFKKDFKRFRNQPRKVERLLQVVRMLENEEPIPQEMKPHMLTGNYSGCMECHIESDYLLIWMDEAEQVIKLLRLGSHSELF